MKRTILFYILLALICFAGQSCSKSSNGSDGSSIGTGGSLARFTISGNYLYVVDRTLLNTYDISQPNSIRMVATTQIGFGIETIYPYEDMLFIGSENSLIIYSIENPEKPTFVAQAQHARACDPVVASGNFAYVTVRSNNNGSPCGGNTNALMVYNIANVNAPQMLAQKLLNNPHGLTIKNQYLYVCDDHSGLQVINVANPYEPNIEQTVTGYQFFDIIQKDDLLICMVNGGMVIYSIANNPANPVFITKTF